MAWGSLIGAGAGIGGGLIQGNANSNEQRKQSTLEHYYQNAYGQISGDEQSVQNNLTAQQFALSGRGYGAFGTAGQQMGSPDRNRAGQTAYGQEMGNLGQVNAYMQPYTQQAQDRSNMASPGYQGWGAQAMSQRYGQPLQAQQGLYAQSAANQAQGRYDTRTLNQLGQTQADIGYQGQQDQSYAGLMNGYGNLMLQQQAVADSYQGPSKSFYNQQLLGQGLSAAGSGLGSYTAYNS